MFIFMFISLYIYIYIHILYTHIHVRMNMSYFKQILCVCVFTKGNVYVDMYAHVNANNPWTCVHRRATAKTHPFQQLALPPVEAIRRAGQTGLA